MIKNIGNTLIDYCYLYPNIIFTPNILIQPYLFDSTNKINLNYKDITTNFPNYGINNYKVIDINMNINYPENQLFFTTNKNIIIMDISNNPYYYVDTSSNFRIFIITPINFIKYINLSNNIDATHNFINKFKQTYISINPDYTYSIAYSLDNSYITFKSNYSKVPYDYTEDQGLTYCKDITTAGSIPFVPTVVSSKSPFALLNREINLLDMSSSIVLYDSSTPQTFVVSIYDTTYNTNNSISYQIINSINSYNINYHDSTQNISNVYKFLEMNPVKKSVPIMGINNSSGKVIFPNKFKTRVFDYKNFYIEIRNLPSFNYVVRVNLPNKIRDIKFKILDISSNELLNYFYFDNDDVLFIETTNNIGKPNKILKITATESGTYPKNNNIFLLFDDFTSIDTTKQDSSRVSILNKTQAFLNRSGGDAYLRSKIPIDGSNIMMEVRYIPYDSNPNRNRIYLTTSQGGGSPLGYDYYVSDSNQIFYNGNTGKYISQIPYKIRLYNSNGFKIEYSPDGKNILFIGNKLDYNGQTPYITISGTDSDRSKFYVDWVAVTKYTNPPPIVRILDINKFNNSLNNVDDINYVNEEYFIYNKKIYLFPEKENNIYKYYRDITITNDGSSLNNYQIGIELNVGDLIRSQKVKPSLNDIYLLDLDTSSVLPVYIDNIDQTKIIIQTKINIVSNKILRMFYGNYFANNNVMDGESIFDFFDDFDSTTINTDKWNINDSNGFNVNSSKLIGTDTSGYITSKTRFNPPFILETKFFRINKCTNGNTILSLANSTTDCIGYLLHSSATDYYRNNSSWVQLSNTIPANIQTLARFEVKNSTNVDLLVYNLTNNTVYHDIKNISNTVSNEYIHIGTRNDQNNRGEKYSVYQDYIRVRKYTTNNINIIVGSETSNISIDSTNVYPNIIPIKNTQNLIIDATNIPICIHNCIESIPYYFDNTITTNLGTIFPVYIKSLSYDPVIISDNLTDNIPNTSDIKYIFSNLIFDNISNGYFSQLDNTVELSYTKIISNQIHKKAGSLPFIITIPINQISNLSISYYPINTKKVDNMYILDDINTDFITNVVIKSSTLNKLVILQGETI